MCQQREIPAERIEEIDTSLARSMNNLGGAHGPRGDSGGLPDSSKGEEDFAARRCKEHARPVRSPTEFLREEKPPAGGDYWKRPERSLIVFAS